MFLVKFFQLLYKTFPISNKNGHHSIYWNQEKETLQIDVWANEERFPIVVEDITEFNDPVKLVNDIFVCIENSRKPDFVPETEWKKTKL